jgi:HNH endonuclease
MAGGIGQELREKLAAMYVAGQSIPQISGRTGINLSRVRHELLKAGVALRSRSEALRIREGLGDHLRGKTRTFSVDHCQAISAARTAWGEANAAGVSIKASGYVEITRGEHKGRGEHVRIMEERLGRHLLQDEVVHHIDRDRSNNDPNNLALVTRSGHARLHRFEDRLEGVKRSRVNGRFS